MAKTARTPAAAWPPLAASACGAFLLEDDRGSVGLSDGAAVTVGAADGVAVVGLDVVGAEDGLGVGAGVGRGVGLNTGRGVGLPAAIGRGVGRCVVGRGVSVGTGVGIGVGRSVGFGVEQSATSATCTTPHDVDAHGVLKNAS
mmetsp:Transcript_1082/g.3083  ORF Transcript_1082/g.3083 Transcript_1082/m.3083 type:complete len:143 (-) Transcript_1082:85-513(-)